MINQIIKRNIRLLSERYGYEISYFKNVVLIKNEKNFIEIFSKVKDYIEVKYNFEKGTLEIEIQDFEVYDLLIKIFRRKELEKVNLNPMDPLNLADLEEEFGCLSKFEEKLTSLINSEVNYSDLGGNRVLTELYQDILILRDDIGASKSNVINISNDKI
ncbi:MULTISPECIES: hypothetical protein [Chryseobacterium]|uniref:Uncharacterized protein n=1 Tax=Chryseobacterium caseinilyticum TaxID=2771428 RepID=A0ABR8ZDS2_9FLAO|nr:MULTISPECIES: hypothetical protein [Chryseobacterium]KQS93613.1 hypothetical protein ASG21_01165 [Chryseobacterium sp. Leaf394]MBD8083449.1 hypothetical protein [Chryseobacterium caseinilyticum]